MDNQERELFLYYFVFGTPEAKELIEIWLEDIMKTAHFQPQTDPNAHKTIRDMAVLEFIQGIKNRVEDFIQKGVKDGSTDHTGEPSDTEPGDANPAGQFGAPAL